MDSNDCASDCNFQIDFALSPTILTMTAPENTYVITIIGDYENLLSATMICAYLWHTKRFLSYAHTVSGISRTVVVFSPSSDIDAESIRLGLGLTVCVEPLLRFRAEVGVIDHLQQSLLQLFCSMLMLDNWILFAREPLINDFGSFARPSLNERTPALPLLDVCTIEAVTVNYIEGTCTLHGQVSVWKGLRTSETHSSSEFLSTALLIFSGEEVRITEGKSLPDLNISPSLSNIRSEVFLTPFDEANMSRGFSTYLPRDADSFDQYWRYLCGVDVYSHSVLDSSSGGNAPLIPEVRSEVRGKSKGEVRSEVRGKSKDDVRRVVSGKSKGDVRRVVRGKSKGDVRREVRDNAMEDPDDFILDDDISMDLSCTDRGCCPVATGLPLVWKCEVLTAAGPRIVPLSALSSYKFYAAPQRSKQCADCIVKDVASTLRKELLAVSEAYPSGRCQSLSGEDVKRFQKGSYIGSDTGSSSNWHSKISKRRVASSATHGKHSGDNDHVPLGNSLFRIISAQTSVPRVSSRSIVATDERLLLRERQNGQSTETSAKKAGPVFATAAQFRNSIQRGATSGSN